MRIDVRGPAAVSSREAPASGDRRDAIGPIQSGRSARAGRDWHRGGVCALRTGDALRSRSWWSGFLARATARKRPMRSRRPTKYGTVAFCHGDVLRPLLHLICIFIYSGSTKNRGICAKHWGNACWRKTLGERDVTALEGGRAALSPSSRLCAIHTKLVAWAQWGRDFA